MDPFVADRMLESEMEGMQAQARRTRGVVLFFSSFRGGEQVDVVAENLAVEEHHVRPNLMKTAGLDRHANQGRGLGFF